MKQSGSDERLDRVGRALVHASATGSEAEAEAVAASPFLYTRVGARIAAERERMEGGESWLALLGVVWRAVPAMALVAVFALSLVWFANPAGAPAQGGFIDEAVLGDAGIERVVFADRQTLSSDDVLTTILTNDEREVSQ